MTGYYDNLSYAMSAGVTREYTLTETLHYQDGHSLVNDTKTIRQNPFIAISVTHLPGSTHSGATYWMDHDPRIVAVSYTYDQA